MQDVLEVRGRQRGDALPQRLLQAERLRAFAWRSPAYYGTVGPLLDLALARTLALALALALALTLTQP